MLNCSMFSDNTLRETLLTVLCLVDNTLRETLLNCSMFSADNTLRETC